MVEGVVGTEVVLRMDLSLWGANLAPAPQISLA
jgi:hypothetical protein